MNDRLIWVLRDERQGTANQALGVADALSHDYLVKNLVSSIFGGMPNIILGSSLMAIQSSSKEEIVPPWPDLVISSGRRAASVALNIKKRTSGRAFICHMMYPGRIASAGLDLVVVPNHDRIAGERILNIVGAPHLITDSLLAKSRSIWQKQFGTLNKPVVGLLVGGANRQMPFGEIEVNQLADQIAAQQEAYGGSLIVATSRRTGNAARALFDKFRSRNIQPSFWHWWENNAENPYLGILAHADVLIVTGDSVSMLSECCSAPGTLYIFVSDGFRKQKHTLFHQELYELEAARPLDQRTRNWKSIQFNSVIDVGNKVKDMLNW